MDRQFLVEYENHEKEQYAKYDSISERLPKLNGPVFHLTWPCESIWSQIAFSGTIIFPLNPMDQITFKKAYNISTKEIPDLVKFVEDTQKIQFVLTEPPTSYVGLDYLDPIFEEIAPPIFTLNKNYQNSAMQQSFDSAEDELDLLLDVVLTNIQDPSLKQHFREDYIRQYAYLKHFGFTELSDLFYTTLLTDTPLATAYLELTYALLVHPIFDPFKANPVVTIDMLQKTGLANSSIPIDTKKVFFPEVGNFLFKKTARYPNSLQSCKFVINDYKENDLYSVYSALNEAISEENLTAIINKKCEMEEIMDNLWNDKKIQQDKIAYKYGIDVACGMIGLSICGLGGFIGAFGCSAAATTNSQFLDKYAELIAKKVAHPYMATIYNFQKKYSNTQ